MMSGNPTGKHHIFSTLLERTNRILIAVTVVCLLLMMTVVAVNVLGRFFFRFPLTGTVDTVGLLGALLISLGLVPSQIARRNISIPIVTDSLPQQARKIFDSATLFLSILIVAVFAWTGGHYAWEMLLKHERMTVLWLPVAPFRFIWALACLMLLIVLVTHLVEKLRKEKK
jgi:TRAP-type C4-dicarboxylate transport system permease small subunit